MTLPYSKALITGASSGLGRGLCTWFAKQGVTVYAAARRKDQLDALAQGFDGKIVPVVLDVADADRAHDDVKALDAKVGGFDLVIANAGVGNASNGRRIVWANEHQLIKVNVAGAVATLSAVLPAMVERKSGQVVGVSSLAGLVPVPGSAGYNASKAFFTMWLDCIRMDVERVGVTVTCIQPGFVKSEMTAKNKHPMPFLMETEPAVELMGKAIARKEKVFAFPWSMASVVQSIASMPKALQRAAIKRVL